MPLVQLSVLLLLVACIILVDAIEPVTQSLILSGTGKLAFQYQTVCYSDPTIQISIHCEPYRASDL